MDDIFNRKLLRMHRDRAASKIKDSDFLIQHSLNDIVERAHIYRPEFDRVLNIGSRVFDLKQYAKHKLKISQLINTDLSLKMLHSLNGNRVQADEEFLPFLDHSFDLVVSALNLHWVNDLPGTLIQIHRTLKKDGLFIASFIGENSLREVKEVFIKSESDLNKNINFHVSPTIATNSLASLMQRAKFQDVVADQHTLKVFYDHPKKILSDLQNMGESNCMNHGKIRYMRKDVLEKFYKNYFDMFPNGEGGVICRFDIITCMGYGG